MLRHLPIQLLLALGLTSGLAVADTITGQVVDSNGVGVANVNIDGFDLSTGTEVVILNDGTDAGGFFTSTIPAGDYQLLFKPPPPPTTTLLVGEIPSINISGTVNLGTIQLETGVSVAGRITDPSSAGVFNANIDVVRKPGSVQVELVGDNTDVNGDFILAVPIGPIEFRIDPRPVSGQTLAGVSFDLDLSANLNMGTVQLQQGWLVTGLVRRMNGTAVSSADLDAVDSNTGVKHYTPGDNTDGNGFFDFVVASGTYDFEVCANVADRLATYLLTGQAISGNTNLGVITMQAGVLLSGHVKGTANQPIHQVDLDLFPAGGGAEIPTCGDNTNEQGDYAFVVPSGTFDILFTPEVGTPYCPLRFSSITINSDGVLNATLADSVGTNYCVGNPNSTGSVANITACGSASSSAGDLMLTSTPVPNQPGIFFHGANQINVAFGNGRLCVGGGLRRGNIVGASNHMATYTYDNSNIKHDLSAHIGATRNFQHWYRDPMGGGAQFNTSLAVSIDILP